MASRRPNKKRQTKSRQTPRQYTPKAKVTELTFRSDMTVADIAKELNLSNALLVKKLMNLGLMATVNHILDRDTVELLALDLGVTVVDEVITDLTRYDEIEVEDDPKDLVKRSPIITIMGHVDHGKTTLLDTIRKARVAPGEAGGITQHIGAYQINWKNEPITFIDTPGHEAFTDMRARGAKVTDIVILVVAADDGVKPQTLEAIDHAKAAKVPIIVAINKIDKPNSNPENVKSALSNHGLAPEEWGGDTPYVLVSALKGEGIDELLDVILVYAEMEDLKANPKRNARGTVIESSLDKGRGPVATLIVETGTLKVGDNLVVGSTFGKVRTLNDDLNKRYKEVLPGSPIEVTGLNSVPKAGDIFLVLDDEKLARQTAEGILSKEREAVSKLQKVTSLDSLFNKEEDSEKELNIILKADVQGSIEALNGMLQKLDIDGFHVNVIRSSVGAITETDVTLAQASSAILIGFNVRPNAAVKNLASDEGVEIRLYDVVYRVIEDIEKALKGMLEPVFEEVFSGQAEVRDIFKISRIGTIAGCMVTDGVIKRDGFATVIREGVVIYKGKIASLKRVKDDVKEVRTGFECGISIENFNDIKVNDIIEVSIEKEVEVL
ncbi:MAG: translation initiation factor IF-2 [Acholeplasmataceae bacterium]